MCRLKGSVERGGRGGGGEWLLGGKIRLMKKENLRTRGFIAVMEPLVAIHGEF